MFYRGEGGGLFIGTEKKTVCLTAPVTRWRPSSEKYKANHRNGPRIRRVLKLMKDLVRLVSALCNDETVTFSPPHFVKYSHIDPALSNVSSVSYDLSQVSND